jgi:membrane fusion protein (multidrug efflux system)
MYAKVKGYDKSVMADRGTVVRKGQTLAVLEAPELQAQLAEALARVEDYKTQYLTSKLTWQRMIQISHTPGAMALNELDVAKSKMTIDSMQVISATRSWQAKEQMVNYLTITAPFDGIVTKRTISPGELVGPETEGKPMFVAESNATLRLTVAVPEIYSSQLSTGAEVTFKVNSLPEKVFTARLSRSAESIDVPLRSMYAEFDVVNSAHQLKSGMYAEVSLPVERSGTTLFVPSSAVINSTEKIFVIGIAGDRAKWINVRVGTQLDTLTEVFGPLKAGDLIVSKASEEIRDGSEVRAVSRKKEN